MENKTEILELLKKWVRDANDEWKWARINFRNLREAEESNENMEIQEGFYHGYKMEDAKKRKSVKHILQLGGIIGYEVVVDKAKQEYVLREVA